MSHNIKTNPNKSRCGKRLAEFKVELDEAKQKLQARNQNLSAQIERLKKAEEKPRGSLREKCISVDGSQSKTI